MKPSSVSSILRAQSDGDKERSPANRLQENISDEQEEPVYISDNKQYNCSLKFHARITYQCKLTLQVYVTKLFISTVGLWVNIQ